MSTRPIDDAPASNRPAPRRRGVSLLEVIIAGSLGLLIMGATYQMLVPGLKAWATSNVRSHQRQNGLAVMNRVAHEMRYSTPASFVTVYERDAEGKPTTTVLWATFISALDDQGQLHHGEDGCVVWKKYIFLRARYDRKELWLGERDLAHDADGNLVYRYKNMASDPRDRVICRDLALFTLRLSIDPFAVNLVRNEPARSNPIFIGFRFKKDDEECFLTTAVSANLAADPRVEAPEEAETPTP